MKAIGNIKSSEIESKIYLYEKYKRISDFTSQLTVGNSSKTIFK